MNTTYRNTHICLVLLFWFIDKRTTNIRLLGHTHTHISPPTQAFYGPVQDPAQYLHKSTRGPFQGTNWRTRPITDQFIPTNHRSLYSDQSEDTLFRPITHQPRGPKKRSHGPEKAVPAHTAEDRYGVCDIASLGIFPSGVLLHSRQHGFF